MTHRYALRPAMTALAAVLALSSIPSFAQNAGDPVVTSTPAVDVTPAPIAADPIAPADTTVAVDPVVTRTTSTATHKATVTKTTATHARPAPARASTTVRTIAPTAPTVAIATPIAKPPAVQTLPVEPVAVAPVVAPPVAQAPATTIDLLSTAGLGALGLLVLVGGALLLRNRRRRRLEVIDELEWQQEAEAQAAADADPELAVEPEASPDLAEPAFIAAAPAVQAETETESEPKFIGPETELSENFDLSRFGPNVQDAYRGPTEDNPSASLKQRLRRANGMDQQERKLDAEVEAATGEPVLSESEPAEPVVAE